MTLVLIILGAFLPTKSLAGDGGCPWRHLSRQTKGAALSAGLSGGPAALARQIPPAELVRAEENCGRTTANADALAHAESGYMLQILSENWIEKHTGVTPENLNLAWDSMDRGVRSGLERWAMSMVPNSDNVDKAYKAFISRLRLQPPTPELIKPQLVTYLQGRALRAVYEPLF
jgi:hypothetical protein